MFWFLRDFRVLTPLINERVIKREWTIMYAVPQWQADEWTKIAFFVCCCCSAAATVNVVIVVGSSTRRGLKHTTTLTMRDSSFLRTSDIKTRKIFFRLALLGAAVRCVLYTVCRCRLHSLSNILCQSSRLHENHGDEWTEGVLRLSGDGTTFAWHLSITYSFYVDPLANDSYHWTKIKSAVS